MEMLNETEASEFSTAPNHLTSNILGKNIRFFKFEPGDKRVSRKIMEFVSGLCK